MKKTDSSQLSEALSETYDVMVKSFKHQFLSYETRRVLMIDTLMFGGLSFNEWLNLLKPQVDTLGSYELDITFQMLGDHLSSESNLYTMKHIELSNEFSVISADLISEADDFTKKMFVYGVTNHLMISTDAKLLELDKDNFLNSISPRQLKDKVKKLFDIRIEILQLETKMNRRDVK